MEYIMALGKTFVEKRLLDFLLRCEYNIVFMLKFKG